MQDIERKVIAILKILSGEKEPVGAGQISKLLKKHGIDLTERAVRYHLKITDERGLTKPNGKKGRLLTDKGREEVSNALVADKLGLVITKIDTLSYLADVDLKKKSGNVIINISFIPRELFKSALETMRDAFAAKLGICDLVAIAHGGETLGNIEVPRDSVAFGSVCSITLNSLFLQAGIPIDSRFGGIVQFEKGKALRFTDLITYSGTTIDPLEIFIASKMTSVLEVSKTGSGKVLASFRDIPAVAPEKASVIIEDLKEAGFYGVLAFGRPGQPVLEMEVNQGRIGMVFMGGLNPLASLEEAGIKTNSQAMSTLINYQRLVNFWDLLESEKGG
ncbi:MAG: NrpR regulatory domain-containing protein [Actinomycetota bacterium]|nr:NrpR regulatory domain-containing protein [Actinomycetota bacterium]